MRLGPQTWYKTKDTKPYGDGMCLVCFKPSSECHHGTGVAPSEPCENESCRLTQWQCNLLGDIVYEASTSKRRLMAQALRMGDKSAALEPSVDSDSYGHETLSTQQDTAKTLAELDDGAEHLPEHLYDSEPTSPEGGELEGIRYTYKEMIEPSDLHEDGSGQGWILETDRRIKAFAVESYKQGQRDTIQSVIEAFSGEHPSSTVTGFVQEELQPWLKKRMDEFNQGEEDESI